MQEHLLGYLLGALEPHEHESLASHLENDPQLREQLERLRGCLHPLATDGGHLEPPPGLARRTCIYVSHCCEETRVAAAGASRWRWQDVVVVTGVLAASLMLIFPAITSSQSDARITGCANNLREMSLALFHYAQSRGDLPGIEKDLPYAGVYAPKLLEAGYLPDPGLTLCPAVARSADPPRAPSLAELRSSTGARLAWLVDRIGGDYGYTLGYLQNGRLVPIRNLGRSDFPLMADAPSRHLPGRQSANHRGRGQNLLFEDGHVEFVTRCPRCSASDDYFHNEDGLVAAGKHVRDSVIGHSSAQPILFVRQPR
jgi:hypothetical protein